MFHRLEFRCNDDGWNGRTIISSKGPRYVPATCGSLRSLYHKLPPLHGAPVLGVMHIGGYSMKKVDFYIQEAIAQAEYSLMAYGEYESAMRAGDTKLVFYHLHHFVLHVTNIDKLLFPKSNSFRQELLHGVQEKVKIELSSIRKLRNHLEHFDERLDGYVKNYEGQAFFDCNIVTGCKGFPEKDFLRAVDGNTYKFYGEKFDLTEIHSHLAPLVKTLKGEQGAA